MERCWEHTANHLLQTSSRLPQIQNSPGWFLEIYLVSPKDSFRRKLRCRCRTSVWLPAKRGPSPCFSGNFSLFVSYFLPVIEFLRGFTLKFLTKRKESLILVSPGTLLSGKCPNRKPCGCGGIGRRAGFRCLWASARGGSTPLIRIGLAYRIARGSGESFNR